MESTPLRRHQKTRLDAGRCLVGFVVAGVLTASLACELNPGAQRLRDDGPAYRNNSVRRDAPHAIVLGLTPTGPAHDVLARHSGIARYLSHAAQLPVRLKVGRSYLEVEQMLLRHEIHLALIAPRAYVTAKRDIPGLIPLAAPVLGGTTTYTSYILVRADAPYTSLHALRGARLGFVDRYSASGYLFPMAYLVRMGAHPPTYFSSQSFFGDHQRLLAALAHGEVDAVASYLLPDWQLGVSTRNEPVQVRILAKTGQVPYSALVAHPSLPVGLVNTLRDALVRLDRRTPEGREVLVDHPGVNGFAIVSDSTYDGIRDAERTVRMALGPAP